MSWIMSNWPHVLVADRRVPHPDFPAGRVVLVRCYDGVVRTGSVYSSTPRSVQVTCYGDPRGGLENTYTLYRGQWSSGSRRWLVGPGYAETTQS